MSDSRLTLEVCINKRDRESGRPSCHARGSLELCRKLKQATADLAVDVKMVPCMGCCDKGPSVHLKMENSDIWLDHADVDKVMSHLPPGISKAGK